MRRTLVHFAFPLVLCGACADVQARPPLLPFEAAPPRLQGTPPPKTGAPRMPKEGDHVLDMRVYYGIPILQKSLLWDGNGEVDQFGMRFRYLTHTSDLVALGAGLSIMNFLLGGSDVQAAEADAIGRFYLHSEETWGAFLEVTGGYLQATDAIPPGGTEWNFTFSWGAGVDVPVGDDVDFIAGATYHHISNALGRQNPRNPSQNEAQLWVGSGPR
jgi:hypothetical protein